MKKTDLAALLAGLLLLTGCGIPMHAPAASSVPEPAETAAQDEDSAVGETAETIPQATAAPQSLAERLKGIRTDKTAVLTDECGVLSGDDAANYLTQLQGLSDSRLLCTAVLITDSISGETPERFAARYYHALFGSGTSGFLLLINNDTGVDVFHREGACEVYLTDTDLRIAQATPFLVEGNYPAAFDMLLPAAEAVPELVFDRSGALEDGQRQALLAKAQETSRAMLLTDHAPQPAKDEEAAEVLAAYAEELRVRTGAETLLVGDVPHKRFAAAGDVPETLTEEMQTIWDEKSLYEALELYYSSPEN